MIMEVTIPIYDTNELALVHQLMGILEKNRRALMDQMEAAREAAQTQEAADDRAAVAAALAEGGEPIPYEEVRKELGLDTPAEVVASITPTATVKLSDMEAAAQKAIQVGGLAAVRAIVNEYGQSRIREIKAALWPEVLEKLANVKPLVAAE